MADIDIPTKYTITVDQLALAGAVGADVDLGGAVGLNLLGLNDVNIDLSGDLDIGLDDVNVALDPVSLHLDPVSVDLGLDNIRADLGLDNIKVDLGLDNVKVDLGLDDINVCFDLAVTELPNVRINVPTRYDFGFSLFGCRIFNFDFSGETALISQDNPPQIFHQSLPPKPPVQPQDLQTFAYKVTLSEEDKTVEGDAMSYES